MTTARRLHSFQNEREQESAAASFGKSCSTSTVSSAKNSLAHYHKRSNVETVFSMIKAQFGERLRSKSETAQINEALTKVLCHNLIVVIQSNVRTGHHAGVLE